MFCGTFILEFETGEFVLQSTDLAKETKGDPFDVCSETVDSWEFKFELF